MYIKCLLAIICLLFVSLGYTNPEEAPHNWPCVQRYVYELSAAALWSGPLHETTDQDLSEDDPQSALVDALANRRIDLEDAKAQTETYLSLHKNDQELLASKLFAGVFAKVQNERRRVIKGIFRYTNRQRMLGKRIEEQRRKLEGASSQHLDAVEREDLEARQTWDIRALRERERQLNYLCEQPVKLEQRLFMVARYLQGYLRE